MYSKWSAIEENKYKVIKGDQDIRDESRDKEMKRGQDKGERR